MCDSLFFRCLVSFSFYIIHNSYRNTQYIMIGWHEYYIGDIGTIPWQFNTFSSYLLREITMITYSLVDIFSISNRKDLLFLFLLFHIGKSLTWGSDLEFSQRNDIILAHKDNSIAYSYFEKGSYICCNSCSNMITNNGKI